MRPIISLACGLVAFIVQSPLAFADQPVVDTAAAGSIPQLGICRAADADNVEIQYALEKLVFETAPGAAAGAPRVEGRTLPTEARAAVEQRVRVVAIGQFVAQRPDGSEVAKADLLKLVAQPTPVLLGKTGQKIDPLFLGILKPDALVLLLPEQLLHPRPVAPQHPNGLAQPPRPASPTPASPAPAIPAVPRKFGS